MVSTVLIPNDNGMVRVISANGAWERFSSETTFAKAIEMVTLEKAVIIDANTVQKAYCKRMLRRLVKRRDNHVCHYCGKRGTTVDHVVPLDKGGKWTLDNLVCACEPCNRAKGNKDYAKFIAERGGARVGAIFNVQMQSKANQLRAVR